MPSRDKERRNEVNREWAARNRERSRQSSKEWHKKNPEKSAALKRSWRKKNPDRALEISRRHWLRKLYGLTIERFNEMRAEQGDACALCGKPLGEMLPRVDHCHATGKVRGLVHHRCNLLLGMAEEGTELLRAAIAYLERTSADEARLHPGETQ